MKPINQKPMNQKQTQSKEAVPGSSGQDNSHDITKHTGKIVGRFRDYMLSDGRFIVFGKSGIAEINIPLETADREMFEAYLAACRLKVIAEDDK